MISSIDIYPQVFYLLRVKWFQVFLFNTYNSI